MERTAVAEAPPKPIERKFAFALSPEGPDPDLVEMIARLKALDLPDSDGEPVENERERFQISLGLETLDYAWQDREDFYTGGNMFLYYSTEQANRVIAEVDDPKLPKRAFRGPDLFIVLNVDGSHRRQKWVAWEEGGRYPDVIFEFLSPRTRNADLGVKKTLYEQTFRTPEYFCFDYLKPNRKDSLLGWRLDDHGNYQPIKPDARGWLWSEVLNLWVGKWYGTYARDTTDWLRFYTPEGEVLPTKAEAEKQRAEAEKQRAEVEKQRAEVEKQRAEAEKQRAEAEKQRAEAAEQHAKHEQQRAEQEAAARQAAEDEVARLRAEMARLRSATGQ